MMFTIYDDRYVGADDADDCVMMMITTLTTLMIVLLLLILRMIIRIMPFSAYTVDDKEKVEDDEEYVYVVLC